MKKNPFTNREPFKEGIEKAKSFFKEYQQLTEQEKSDEALLCLKQCSEQAFTAVLRGMMQTLPSPFNLYALRKKINRLKIDSVSALPITKSKKADKVKRLSMVGTSEALPIKENDRSYLKNQCERLLSQIERLYDNTKPCYTKLSEKGEQTLQDLSEKEVEKHIKALDTLLYCWDGNLYHRQNRWYLDLLKSFAISLNADPEQRVPLFNSQVLGTNTPQISKGCIITHLEVLQRQKEVHEHQITLLLFLNSLVGHIDYIKVEGI